MRFSTLLVAASLLAFSIAALPGAEAAREPVGSCGEDVIVEICAAPCINPPCPIYVCIHPRSSSECLLP